MRHSPPTFGDGGPSRSRRAVSKAVRSLGTLALLVMFAQPASAQSPVSPGQRIRATMNNGGVVIGAVTAVSGTQSLTVNVEGAPVTVDLGGVRMLEVSRGRQSAVMKGAMYGGGVGLLGGLAFSRKATSARVDVTDTGVNVETDEAISWGGVALWGISGALNGLWVGYFLLGEDWSRIPGFGSAGPDLVLEAHPWSAVSVGLRVPVGSW